MQAVSNPYSRSTFTNALTYGKTELNGRRKYVYSFNGKEDISELNDWQDYGERMYMRRLGRFPSPDPIIIYGKQYPMLSPYQFASNTPIQAIDLDGLEAFYVHGTWSNPSTFSQLSISTVNEITSNTTGPHFKWSGNNTNRARRKAAKDLANHIIKNRDPNQPLTVVGHSHGGNVGVLAANILKKKGVQVDNIITINTPVREYQLDEGAATRHVNIYQEWDPVQAGGGNAVNIPDGGIIIPMPGSTPIVIPTFEGSKQGTGEMGPAGRRFDGAINIGVPMDRNNIHNTHNTPNQWQGALDNAINPKPTNFDNIPTPQNNVAEPDNTRVAPRIVPQQ
jgi:RHS repeat-associated protein